MNHGFAELGEISRINPPLERQPSPDEMVAFLPMAGVTAELADVVPVEIREAREVKNGFTSFQNDDVLVAKITPCFENGKIALANLHGQVGYGSTEFHVVRADPTIVHPRYLLHFLRQKRVLHDGEQKMTGSAGQKRVPKDFIERLKIFVPSLEEQKQSVASLDAADEILTKRRASIRLLDSLAASIFLDVFGDPATNPHELPSCKLGDIIDFVGGSQPPKSTFLYEDGPERVRFVQTRDFRTDNYLTYVPKHLAKRPFVETDVMIGRYGPPVFQIFRGLAGTYNVALMKAKPREGITEEFVFHLLKERKLHSFVVANSERTAGQSGVNLRLLNGYPAYRPSLELQASFADRMSAVKVMQQECKRSLAKVDALRTALQDRVFRGEL